MACALIFALGECLLLIGIQAPNKLYFDETQYVPAAWSILQQGTDPNFEHPPLAKELIAAGIALFGDQPLGWRFMSVLFGALSLVGIYLWALALFKDERAARWATLITALNQALYVQARIAMLDIFAVAFSIWAIAAFTATWRPEFKTRTRTLLAATGIFLGLASACKWTGVFLWVLIVSLVMAIKIFQRWKTRFEEPSETDWYRGDLWQGIGARQWLAYLVAIPLCAYYLSYAPLGFRALLPVNFLDAQSAIFHANASLNATHPYMSKWTDWPIMRRPVWYFFEASNWDTDRASAGAVLYLGNPAVFWAGAIAMIACLYGWIARRRADAFLILATFGATYLVWAMVSRPLAFSYYYLTPAMTLGVALAYAFFKTPLNAWPWARHAFLAACLILFAYFLPITSAAVRVSEPGFNQSMWFQSWR